MRIGRWRREGVERATPLQCRHQRCAVQPGPKSKPGLIRIAIASRYVPRMSKVYVNGSGETVTPMVRSVAGAKSATLWNELRPPDQITDHLWLKAV
jgi:hypothetical protein